MKRPKRKFPTDTEVGIRPINVIEKMPVGQLSDEEVCKLFFARFEAVALVMSYVDGEGVEHSFGRLKRGESVIRAYRALLQYNRIAFRLLRHNWKMLQL